MARLGAQVLLMGASALGFLCNAAHADTLQDIGDLPGGDVFAHPAGVSADGSAIAGTSSSSAFLAEAYIWTLAGGMIGLGDLPGGVGFSQAEGISSDGLVVVGESDSTSGLQAFRWTAGTGMVGLGALPGGFESIAMGVNADGAVVVGVSETALGYEAFRWTEAGGMIGLGYLAGGSFFSSANDTSADGAVIVGQSESAFGFEAFRWTQSGGMVGLGDLPGGAFYSEAIAVSDDGLVVVGGSEVDALGYEAFRWTQTTGMVGLGDLPGGDHLSLAWDTNADGSIVVGTGSDAAGFSAFVWTQANGMRAVADVLAENGVDMTGWTLTDATGVSDDGTIIVGFSVDGLTGRAWIANINLGIVNVDDLAQSLSAVAGVTQTAQQAGAARVGTLLELATHYGVARSAGWSAWGGVSHQRYDSFNTEPEALSGHLGVAFDSTSSWRAGFGVQWDQREDDLDFFDSDTDTIGVGAFVAYEPGGSGLRLYGALSADRIESDITRNYFNGATPASSSGAQDGEVLSAGVQAGWALAVGGSTTLTPYASYEVSQLELDGYTETGGPFPATFDDVEDTLEVARAGVELGHGFTEHVRGWANVAYARRFGDTLAELSGAVTALASPFAIPGAPLDQDWLEGGAGLEVSMHEAVRLQAALYTATSGDTSPNLNGRLTLIYDF